MRNRLAAVVAIVAIATTAYAQSSPGSSGYLLPPKAIVDMLDAPPPPTAEVSPARDVIALLERASMPTIAELSQPFYRLAGVRINPRTNAPHRGQRYRNLTLKVIADGSERKVTLPQSPVVEWIGFSADGKRFAFTNLRENGVELWIGETATGQAKSVTPAQLNSVFGSPCSFVAEGNSLLCAFINTNRGAAPQAPSAPTGPNIQESRGVVASVATVQDMLGSVLDENLFEYYGTSQLATVDANTGQRTAIGRPAIYTNFSPSPDGNFALLASVKRPFSWVVPFQRFPTTAQIVDKRGALVKALADVPLTDDVPRGGVAKGPRNWRWIPTVPATIAYAEALDGGNPKTKVEFRDKVMTLAAPFTASPAELTKIGR